MNLLLLVVYCQSVFLANNFTKNEEGETFYESVVDDRLFSTKIYSKYRYSIVAQDTIKLKGESRKLYVYSKNVDDGPLFQYSATVVKVVLRNKFETQTFGEIVDIILFIMDFSSHSLPEMEIFHYVYCNAIEVGFDDSSEQKANKLNKLKIEADSHSYNLLLFFLSSLTKVSIADLKPWHQ